MRFEKPDVLVDLALNLGEQIGGVLVTTAVGAVDGRAYLAAEVRNRGGQCVDVVAPCRDRQGVRLQGRVPATT